MTDLELHPDLAPAPTTLFASASPAVIVARATEVADAIAPLIRNQGLVKRIGQSEHVFLEGWTLAGTMLGVFPITVASGAIFAPDGAVLGYQATVEARTMAGNVVGRADAECTRDENDKWRQAPSFQLRSMAITRASSKALRMPLGFVMKLAGYETTPAEEMEAAAARGETVTGGRGVRPGWRDIGEQQHAHADVGQLIENLGARQWVAEWLESKGYERPLAKGQLNQLRRAIEREFEQSDPGSRATPGTAGDDVPASPGSDPKSPPTPVEKAHPTQAGPAGVEGANQSKPDAGTPPSDVTTPPGSSPPEPGGTNRPTSGGAKGAHQDKRRSRGSATHEPGESHGAAAGRDEAQQAAFTSPLTGGDPGRFTR